MGGEKEKKERRKGEEREKKGRSLASRSLWP